MHPLHSLRRAGQNRNCTKEVQIKKQVSPWETDGETEENAFHDRNHRAVSRIFGFAASDGSFFALRQNDLESA